MYDIYKDMFMFLLELIMNLKMIFTGTHMSTDFRGFKVL